MVLLDPSCGRLQAVLVLALVMGGIVGGVVWRSPGVPHVFVYRRLPNTVDSKHLGYGPGKIRASFASSLGSGIGG